MPASHSRICWTYAATSARGSHPNHLSRQRYLTRSCTQQFLHPAEAHRSCGGSRLTRHRGSALCGAGHVGGGDHAPDEGRCGRARRRHRVAPSLRLRILSHAQPQICKRHTALAVAPACWLPRLFQHQPASIERGGCAGGPQRSSLSTAAASQSGGSGPGIPLLRSVPVTDVASGVPEMPGGVSWLRGDRGDALRRGRGAAGGGMLHRPSGAEGLGADSGLGGAGGRGQRPPAGHAGFGLCVLVLAVRLRLCTAAGWPAAVLIGRAKACWRAR